MSGAGDELRQHIGLRTAAALVVANIIGAGIFTTTGFQAADLGHPGYIFLLWIAGGALAFCGALCYSELGAAMPHAGAEYVYLRETYGPAFGFTSAVVSLIAGFSAPIAAALKAFTEYAAALTPVLAADTRLFGIVSAQNAGALALAWLLVGIHCRGGHGGTLFNDLITLFKVCGIVLIILAAFALGKGDAGNLVRVAPWYTELGGADKLTAFATGLIFVMFCYSGWNAAAYVAREMHNPQRDLPRALLIGTSIVILLYLGLNAVYFYGGGVESLTTTITEDGETRVIGEVEVGLIAGRELFGSTGVTLVTLILCVSIFASASAMTIAGPRVYYAFGRDYPPLAILARTGTRTGAPVPALLLQGAVTSVIILAGRIDEIIIYTGFTLSLFASLAVSCVLVLRVRQPDLVRPFKAWGYPVTPVLFLVVMIWTMAWTVRGRPVESLLGLTTAFAGGIAFYISSRFASKRGDSGT